MLIWNWVIFQPLRNAYDKAAEHHPNKQFSPVYLMKAAVAYENLSDTATAIERYNEIIEQYWDSTEAQNAKKHKARLEASAS